MNKEDWLEYFEAINGRTPSEVEVQQALADGEFVSPQETVVPQPQPQVALEPTYDVAEEPIFDTPVEQVGVAPQAAQEYFEESQAVYEEPQVQLESDQATFTTANIPAQQSVQSVQSAQAIESTQVQPQPQPQPQPQSQSQSQSQFNQHQIPTQPQPQPQPTTQVHPQSQPQFNQQQIPAQPQPQSQAAGRTTVSVFWQWLVSAWKAPTSVVPTNSYNGWIGLGILTLLATILLFSVAYNAGKIGSGLLNGLGSLFGEEVTATVNNPIGVTQFFQILLSVALYIFSNIVAGFVAKRFIYKDVEFTFSRSIEYFSRLFSINMIILAVGAVFGLVSSNLLALLFLVIAMSIFSSANVFAIAYSKDYSNLDQFYKYLIAIIVVSVVLGLFSIAEVRLISSSVLSVISNLF